MDYHIFKKATKSKNKMVHRWYYYYNDVITGSPLCQYRCREILQKSCQFFDLWV